MGSVRSGRQHTYLQDLVRVARDKLADVCDPEIWGRSRMTPRAAPAELTGRLCH